MTRINVYEYPKSGGSWLIGLLGDLLDLPKRDIYVKEGFDAFDIRKHPWYIDQDSLNIPEECVIKSHELPSSKLNVSGKRIHLIRDGRDVVVSKYSFEKDFCVKNGLYPSFEVGFEDYLIKTAQEWRAYVERWSEQEEVIVVRYEALLENPITTLEKLLQDLDERPVRSLEEALVMNSKENMREALGKVFASNTFVRKGIKGDWKQHFAESHKALFNEHAGDLLVALNYEQDAHW